jgi:Ca2+-binding RTX toxin-like protein
MATLIGSNFNEVIAGTFVADEIFGLDGADGLIGRDGRDSLFGGNGNDTLLGGNGDDVLHGDADNDRLLGGAGSDDLNGGAGNDALLGGTGNDTLSGGAGDDELFGGAGKDIMTGGEGKSTYVYTALKDSPAGRGRDVIVDFKTLIDDVDMRAIDAVAGTADNDVFTFIGATTFSGVAGQLNYRLIDRVGTASDVTLIQADVNGDRVADFQVELTGLIRLSSDDFML